MKLKAPLRLSINSKFYDICRTYHNSIPIKQISELLGQHNIKFAEDFLLTGRDSGDKFDLTMNGEPLESWLVLTWYKFDTTGRWEVNAYLS